MTSFAELLENYAKAIRAHERGETDNRPVILARKAVEARVAEMEAALVVAAGG